MGMFSRDPIDPPLKCSFCDKTQGDVKQLIAGPEVFICDECVSVCNEIVGNNQRATLLATEPLSATEPLLTTEPPAPAVNPSTTIVTCALCRMQLPWDDAVTVPERGALCPGCVAAIQAAVAEQRGDGA